MLKANLTALALQTALFSKHLILTLLLTLIFHWQEPAGKCQFGRYICKLNYYMQVLYASCNFQYVININKQ